MLDCPLLALTETAAADCSRVRLYPPPVSVLQIRLLLLSAGVTLLGHYSLRTGMTNEKGLKSSFIFLNPADVTVVRRLVKVRIAAMKTFL